MLLNPYPNSSATTLAMVDFLQKNTLNKSIVSGTQARNMSSEYISLCLSFFRKKQNLPAEISQFYETASPVFKQEVNWLLRPYSIEFDDLLNGREEAIHKLVNSFA